MDQQQSDQRVEYNRYAMRRTDDELKPIVELCLRYGKEMHDNPGVGWRTKNLLWKMEKQGIVGAPQASAPINPPPPELMRIDFAVSNIRPILAATALEKYYFSPHLPYEAQARNLGRRLGRYVSAPQFSRMSNSALEAIYAVYMSQL
jgi:hypothetical protein